MTADKAGVPFAYSVSRRKLLHYSAGIGLAAGLSGPLRAWAQTGAMGTDAAQWTPEYIRSIAGTIEVDTAAPSVPRWCPWIIRAN